MPNGCLHSWSAHEPALLLLSQTLELSSVNDLSVEFGDVHTAKPQINNDPFRLQPHAMRKDDCLLQHGAQNVAVARITEGGHHSTLDTIVIGLARFALVKHSTSAACGA